MHPTEYPPILLRAPESSATVPTDIFEGFAQLIVENIPTDLGDRRVRVMALDEARLGSIGWHKRRIALGVTLVSRAVPFTEVPSASCSAIAQALLSPILLFHKGVFLRSLNSLWQFRQRK